MTNPRRQFFMFCVIVKIYETVRHVREPLTTFKVHKTIMSKYRRSPCKAQKQEVKNPQTDVPRPPNYWKWLFAQQLGLKAIPEGMKYS
jgi:hypothetical protein